VVQLNVSDRVVIGHPGIQEGFGCEFFVDPNSKGGFIVMNNLGIYGVDDSGSLVKEGAPAQPVEAYLGKQQLQDID